MTHICVGNLTVIGLSPGRRQAIIWTNDGILLIRTLGTNFSEILIKIQNFSFKRNIIKNIVCEMAAILSRGISVNGRYSWGFLHWYWKQNHKTVFVIMDPLCLNIPTLLAGGHWYNKEFEFEFAPIPVKSSWMIQIGGIFCGFQSVTHFLTHWGGVTHICAGNLSLAQIMACRLVGAKPLPEPMIEYC